MAALLAVHALGFWTWPLLTRLDLAIHDLRLTAFAPGQLDPRVVLVDIDEQALAAHGRWPWPRDQLARLIEQIGQRGQASLIGLDLVMAEPDNSSGLQALERLAKGPLRQEPALATLLAQGRDLLDHDGRLAQSLRATPSVLGFMLADAAGHLGVGRLPPPFVPATLLGARLDDLHHFEGYTGNLAEFQAAAGHAGHLNAQLDLDGRLRRLPLLAKGPDGQVHASLALVLAQRHLALQRAQQQLAAPTIALMPPADAVAFPPLRRLKIGDSAAAAAAQDARALTLSVPLGQRAEVLVPFRAHGQGYARYSAAQVMAADWPAGAFKGQVVLVGVNAPGLVDQRMTPVNDAMQGSAVHASLLSGLLDSQVGVVPAAAPLVELGLLLVVVAVMLWGLPRLGMLAAVGLAAALALALPLLGTWVWLVWRLALPVAGPMLLAPLILACHVAIAYRRATGARHHLARLFGQYVPPELVQEMSREPERYNMSSRSAELTVLFADVRGFSAIAGRLPPAELSAMMNLLFSRLTDIVREHRGTLDKYIGDAVMAFWGAPMDDARHAQHAVAAALAIRAALPAINADLAQRGWQAVDIHIGVNSGPMVVGDMGSRHRRAYTVMGDAVNLAARLQQLCSQEGLGVLLGEATHSALHDLPCLALGPVPLRGRDTVPRVWLPLDLADTAHRGEVQARWQQARDALAADRPDKALALLDRLDRLAPGLAASAWQRRQIEARGSPQQAA